LSNFRGEISPGTRGPGKVRKASVMGAPSTKKMGAIIANIMWEIMCKENITEE
jgi:hypothetical protein